MTEENTSSIGKSAAGSTPDPGTTSPASERGLAKPYQPPRLTPLGSLRHVVKKSGLSFDAETDEFDRL